MTAHLEKPGHCAKCASEIAALRERLAKLEQAFAVVGDAVGWLNHEVGEGHIDHLRLCDVTSEYPVPEKE